MRTKLQFLVHSTTLIEIEIAEEKKKIHQKLLRVAYVSFNFLYIIISAIV